MNSLPHYTTKLPQQRSNPGQIGAPPIRHTSWARVPNRRRLRQTECSSRDRDTEVLPSGCRAEAGAVFEDVVTPAIGSWLAGLRWKWARGQTSDGDFVV